MLRVWQEECLFTVKQHYSEKHKHFFCLATPGAGKTVLAAEVAYFGRTDQLIRFEPITFFHSLFHS